MIPSGVQVFVESRRVAVKILFFDGSGMCVYYKRLDRRLVIVPVALAPGVQRLEIAEGTLATLLDGIEIALPASRQRPPTHRTD